MCERSAAVFVLMRSLKLLVAFVALVIFVAADPAAAAPYGPQGVEGEPNREQRWLLPTPEGDRAAHAVLFRPPGAGPFRLAVIAHATTQNVLRRAQMPQPEYRALAAFLVERGFAVLVPERLGHGATAGAYLEDQGGCDEADYARSGRATADQIRLAMEYLRGQPSIRPDAAIVIGHSAGGWGALALAAQRSQVETPSRTPRRSRPSSPSRRGAAAMPMISRTGFARRRRCWPRPPRSEEGRGCR